MPFRRTEVAVADHAVPHLVAPQAVDVLRDGIVGERDHTQRAWLVDALVRHHSPAAVEALADLITHPDPAMRSAGVEGLLRMPRALVRQAVATLLRHPAAELRVRALDAIERVPDAEAEALLIALIQDERDANVCAAAVELLAEVGGDVALPALRALRLRFANAPFLAFATDHAMSQIMEG